MKMIPAVLATALTVATALPAAAQYAPARPDAVRPHSQNLMSGPSYWTPQQRRLNVPGATANPSLKRQAPPYTAPTRAAPQPPPRPAETPVPAETPKPEG
jgi:hypothetical protein